MNHVSDLMNEILANTVAAMSNRAIRIRHETQQCGAVVLLTGYFEAFLKDVVRAFAEGLRNSSTDFTSLPDVIQNTHFEAGGKVLTKVSQARRRGGFTPLGTVSREDIVERLFSPAFSQTAKSYFILWEAFADTQSNPGPKVVSEIAKNLGMSDAWRKIASKSGSGRPDSALSAKLESLVIQRNSCAHTGTVSPIPTAVEIIEHIQNLDWVATGLVAALEDELLRY
jgi:hypothetical protein